MDGWMDGGEDLKQAAVVIGMVDCEDRTRQRAASSFSSLCRQNSLRGDGEKPEGQKSVRRTRIECLLYRSLSARKHGTQTPCAAAVLQQAFYAPLHSLRKCFVQQLDDSLHFLNRVVMDERDAHYGIGRINLGL